MFNARKGKSGQSPNIERGSALGFPTHLKRRFLSEERRQLSKDTLTNVPLCSLAAVANQKDSNLRELDVTDRSRNVLIL